MDDWLSKCRVRGGCNSFLPVVTYLGWAQPVFWTVILGFRCRR